MKKIIIAAAFTATTATTAFAGACGPDTQPATSGNFCTFTPTAIAALASAPLGAPGEHLGKNES